MWSSITNKLSVKQNSTKMSQDGIIGIIIIINENNYHYCSKKTIISYY